MLGDRIVTSQILEVMSGISNPPTEVYYKVDGCNDKGVYSEKNWFHLLTITRYFQKFNLQDKLVTFLYTLYSPY